jgi:hypothetical protein
MLSAPSVRCPECGAPLNAAQARCWLCQRKADDGQQQNPYAPPRPLTEHSASQFSLASLFLIMTLVAVCLGVFLLSPGLGVLLVFVMTPALIRTVMAASYQKQAGTALSAADKIGVFLMSVFIMGAIGVAACVAFMATCLLGVAVTEGGGASLEATLLVGLISGLVGAIPLAAWLMRLTRPAKYSPR